MLTLIVGQPQEANAAANGSSIAAQGKKYLGVRYVYGGMSPKGFDCSGFVAYTFKQKGITLPRTSATMYKKGKSVSKSQLREGDLVFFKTGKSGVSHVGIYIGNNKFIHSAGKGVAITNINDPYYWKSRYVGAKRVI
ncbi:MAG TPA: C40 family peptidase [Bacillaceae bacterium]